MTPPADETPAPHRSAPTADPHEGLPEHAELTPELVEETALRNDFMLRLAVVLLAVLMGFTAVDDSRALVHVRTGRHITSEGLPRTDVFSHTAAGRPWVNLSWLFDVLASTLHTMGGWALTALQVVIAAATFGLLIAVRRPGVPTWWGSVCGVLALVVCLPQLTALPESVTLLGTAATLWLLHRWRQTGSSRTLAALPLVMLAWANLDPRAFLGAGLIVLFALGAFLDDLLGRSDDTEPGAGPLLLAALASLVAMLAHPFGWQTWLSPLGLYGVEYPALRAADALLLGGLTARAETMFSPEYWRPVSPQLVAGAALLVAALVTMVLNVKRARLAHALAWLGAAAAAAAARQELALAAVVSAALATLNAQEWFAANFRQAYSTALGDRVFSVGGRLVTALAFVGLAFAFLIGVASPGGARLGVGISDRLAHQAAAVAADVKGLPRDHRGFNFSYREGDLLLWAGQRTFIDSRLQVFATPPTERAKKSDQDKPAKADAAKDDPKPQDAAKQADPKETKKEEAGPKPPLGGSVLADHRRMVEAVRAAAAGAEDAAERVTVWSAGLELYEPTHLLIPLLEPHPAYGVYRAVLMAGPRWGLSRLGAALAVVYNRGVPAAAEYLAEHPWQPQREVFHGRAETIEPWLLEWPSRRPWLTRRLSGPLPTPNAIRKAANYAVHMGTLPVDALSRAVLAHVVIREAHAGLAEQPNSLDGYRQLASAYHAADVAELQLIAEVVGQSVPPDYYDNLAAMLPRRYYQTLAATYQALALAPDDFELHHFLAQRYAERRRLDLALREIEWLLAHWPKNAPAQAKHLRGVLEQQRDRLAEQVETIRGRVDELRVRRVPPLQVAAVVAQNFGCFLLAMELLGDVEAKELEENPQAVLLRVVALTELGRIPEAYRLMEQSQRLMEQVPPAPLSETPWLEWVGYLELMMGRYEPAAEAFEGQADRLRRDAFENFLATFPLAARPVKPYPWFGRVQDGWAMWQALIGERLMHPQSAALMLYNAALTWLEAGRPEQAGELLAECLDVAPAVIVRPVAAVYLEQITGRPVSRFAPGPQADDEPGGPEQPARAEKPARPERPAEAEKPAAPSSVE